MTPKRLPGRVLRRADFLNPRMAYASKSNAQLLLGWAVFGMCSNKWLVQNNARLIALGRTTIGSKLTEKIIKKTFFNWFCAGENEEEMRPRVAELKANHLGAIYDYAAEADVTKSDTKAEVEIGNREGVVSARTFDYRGELECDANMNIMIHGIEVASHTEKEGFSAIKVTALGKPSTLVRITDLLLQIRRVWIAAFSNKRLIEIPLEECRLAIAKREQPDISFPEFNAGLQRLGIMLSDEEVKTLFNSLDVDKNGGIDYIEWTTQLPLSDLSVSSQVDAEGRSLADRARASLVVQLAAKCGVQLLNEDETTLLINLQNRLEKVAEASFKGKVRLLVDAEQTYFQVAIDHLTLALQRKYNKESAVVFETYQCYLKFGKARVLHDLERAKRHGYWFAAKLVRGAYMDQERELAHSKNYETPIWGTIEETHAAYHDCLEIILRNIDRSEILVGSHNQDSIERCTQLMHDLNISPQGGGVYFGQLLGMADNLSLVMAANDYKVYKYVPWGPLNEVIPYLGRRALENGSMMAGAQVERKMMMNEFWRRVNPFSRFGKKEAISSSKSDAATPTPTPLPTA